MEPNEPFEQYFHQLGDVICLMSMKIRTFKMEVSTEIIQIQDILTELNLGD